MQNKINTVMFHLSLFSLIVMFTIIAIFAFWTIYPYRVIEYQDNVFPISKKEVYQGDTISYVVRYCKYMNTPSSVTRSFINSLIYVSPTTINNRETGCHTINIQVTIPKELPPGKYKMQMTYQYDVNPIRKLTFKKDTEQFTVKEATGSAR